MTLGQPPTLAVLFIALDDISSLEISPILEAHTTLGTFAHLGDIFLVGFEGINGAYRSQLAVRADKELNIPS